MSKPRYPTAVEHEKAKLAGVDDQPVEKHRDPLNATLADDRAVPAKAKLKHIGGSDHDRFNIDLANAVLDTCWTTSPEQRRELVGPLGYALAAIGPRDELEGMMAAQMVAAHHASMEGYRRAALPNQTVEGRAMNLKFGTKASQTFAMLLDGLNRHRGKGNNQKVTVEHVHRHVHVHDGAPQVVEHQAGRVGVTTKIEDQPHAPRLAQSAPPLATMRGDDAERERMPLTGDVEQKVPHARRRQPRRTNG